MKPQRIQLRRAKGAASDATTYVVLQCRRCDMPGSKGQQGYCGPECRFWDNVMITESCWVWLGAQHNKKGYGRFDARRRRWLAHRFAYTLLIGPIPDGLELDHLCLNTQCVNPEHLDPVTSEVHDHERTDQGAYNRAKTHCPWGHAYSEGNTRWSGLRRHCRTCDHERRHRAATNPAA